jgi:hypothetical protein
MNKIERILNINEFYQSLDDIIELIKDDDELQLHNFLKHNVQSIKNNISHPSLLAWDFFVWGHKENNKYDALVIFTNDKNIKFGIPIFSEFAWISKNPKIGFKILKEALSFAREKKFQYIIMSTAVRHPKHEKIKNFYEKLGFIKDTENYIAKL